uniref:Putative conserved plasma membrane protein n=1 Tax=Ornithodoros turicata TaxID=34597 RepID=A0A2R5L7N2_9ACAR
MSASSTLRGALKSLFTKHLLVTNVVLGTGFMCVGDGLQQSFEIYRGKEAGYDWARARNMLIIGAAFGLGGHKWYEFLDRKFPGKSLSMVGKKLACEFALCPPLAFTLFVGNGLLSNKSFQQSVKEFKDNIYLFCIADWGCFVPAQAINFYYLPPRYRFLYVAMSTMIYDIFLSFILHRKVEENQPSILHSSKARSE